MDIIRSAIKINTHIKVLDKQDDPIPGLYAVGNDAGGWHGIPIVSSFRVLPAVLPSTQGVSLPKTSLPN